ncbi:hypothetical protein X975_10917, partial [Stegodyphus mimosarum]
MKKLFAVIFAVLLVTAVYGKEEEKKEEKKPVETVVWPGMYTLQWHHTLPLKTVPLIHPVQYHPLYTWWR